MPASQQASRIVAECSDGTMATATRRRSLINAMYEFRSSCRRGAIRPTSESSTTEVTADRPQPKINIVANNGVPWPPTSDG